MIKLPIIKPLEYLSPSTFMISEACEMAVYLSKMSGKDLPRQPQNEQMAIGSIFDSIVKSELAFNLGLSEDKNLLSVLLRSVDEEHLGLLDEGHKIFDQYNFYGCLDELIKEGLLDVELREQKVIAGEVIKGLSGDLQGVNLFGYPDAVLKDRPLDWKVSGWGTSRVKSPKQGYESYRVSSLKNPMTFSDKGRHPRWPLRFEEIDRRWAIQLMFYNWMLYGHDPRRPYYGAIDQIIIKDDGRIGVARFRAQMGQTFCDELWNAVSDFWERTHATTGHAILKNVKPDFFTCEPYGYPRPCTLDCEYYKNTLNDPVTREIMRQGK